jgi:hypothetical protein
MGRRMFPLPIPGFSIFTLQCLEVNPHTDENEMPKRDEFDNSGVGLDWIYGFAAAGFQRRGHADIKGM